MELETFFWVLFIIIDQDYQRKKKKNMFSEPIF